jgi:hypothetical protein
MLAHTRLLFGAVLALAACSANAATQTTVGFDSTRAVRANLEKNSHSQLLLNRATHADAKSTESVSSATPGLPRANPLRTYPPSCLADPLPDQPSGPTYSKNVSLAAFNTNTGLIDSTEIVNITIWRVACSSSQFFNSATLMRINRNSSSQTIYPLFPAIRVSQGSVGYGDSDYPANLARLAIEPNTVISDTLIDTPIINDMTFVLENYDSTATSVFDFNLPFGLRFDNLFASNNLAFIDVPLYDPTTLTYPAAFQNVPISGYLGTNWYDPTADGEGIVLQVYERSNDTSNLVLSFSWSAYDPNGVPFWLFGQVDIARGAKTATAPMFYRTGGGFGGSNGSAGPAISWGTSTVTFPTCNTMTLSYSANPGLPAGVPSGSGTRTWTRIANVNGLLCE